MYAAETDDIRTLANWFLSTPISCVLSFLDTCSSLLPHQQKPSVALVGTSATRGPACNAHCTKRRVGQLTTLLCRERQNKHHNGS